MRFDNRPADRQADAHAGFLGRKEGLKQVLRHVFPKAGSGIGYHNFDHIVRRRHIGYGQFAARGMCHGLERVAKQIDQHLLDLDAVHQHQIVPRVQIEPKLHALLAGAGETERAGFFDQFGKTFDALLGFSPRHEITKPPDDLPGADRLFGSAVQRAFNLGNVGVVAGTQQTARTLHVVADRGERLIELVRKRRRHLSHRAQARDVDQLGLQLLQPCLGLLMFGEIADEAGEVGRAAGLHFADRKMHRKSGSVLALSGYDSTDADDMPFAGGSIAGEVPVVARTVRIWHQDTDVLADRLAFRCSQTAFRRHC